MSKAMREEVRGRRYKGEGSRTRQNMEKEEECSTWNTKRREMREKVPHGTNKRHEKTTSRGGGFDVMNYNKNGRFRKIHMVELTS